MVESWRDILFGLFQNIDKFSCLLGVTTGEEAVGSAGLLGPSRAANTMNIVLSVVREIKIHHKLDIVNICIIVRAKDCEMRAS